MNEQDLVNAKSTIEKAKLKVAKLEGEKETHMKTLKELGCASVEAATDEIQKLTTKVTKLASKLELKKEAFETKYTNLVQ